MTCGWRGVQGGLPKTKPDVARNLVGGSVITASALPEKGKI